MDARRSAGRCGNLEERVQVSRMGDRLFFGRKQTEYYKGMVIRADLKLHEQIADQVVRYLPDGGSVLDLGAGQGALSARLADMGYEVSAADVDADDFKADVHAAFEQLNFDSADEIERFVEAHREQFDAVCGIEVIEHVEDQWRYVRNLKHMLKPGGVMILTTPNVTSWLSRLTFLFKGRFHQFADADVSYGHIAPVTPFEISLILKREGLQQVEMVSAGTLPPLYFSSLRMALISILALLFRPLQSGMLNGWCLLAVARKP